MRATSLTLAAAFGLVLVAGGCGKGDSVTLRLRLKEGATYAFESKISQTTEMQGQKNVADQTLVTTVKVDDASDGRYRTTSSISDVEITSAGVTESQKEDLRKRIEGVRVNLEYDDLGHTLASKSADNKAANSFAASMGAQGVGFMGLHFPSRAVRAGDTWSAEFDIQQVLGSMLAGMKPKGASTIPIKYTLKKIEDRNGKKIGVIAFDMSGSLEFIVENPGRAPVEVKMKTASKGDYVVDLATGIPLESTTTGRNDIEVPGQVLGQDMTIKVKFRE